MTREQSEPAGQSGPPDPATYPRTVLLVAGAGRSGTSTLAVLLQILGMHVPTPEVAADASNPKGFGEPRWVVDHHDALLAEAGVAVGDARPQAWFETGRIAARDEERARIAAWLEGHLAAHPELVVKDPRLSWFLGLWRVAAERAEARPVVATMLRPPAEVAGSRAKYYNNKLGAAHLVASWVNMLLHTELATRDSPRVFVRYADLLDDWVRTTQHVGSTLDLRHVLDARERAAARRAPLHRPEPAPDHRHPRRARPAAAAARDHRAHLDRARRARRARRRHRRRGARPSTS